MSALEIALFGAFVGAVIPSLVALYVHREQSKTARREGLLRTLQWMDDFGYDCRRCACAADEAHDECMREGTGRQIPTPTLKIIEGVAITYVDNASASMIIGFPEALKRVDREADDEWQYGSTPDAYQISTEGYAKIGLQAFSISTKIRSRLAIAPETPAEAAEAIAQLKSLLPTASPGSGDQSLG